MRTTRTQTGRRLAAILLAAGAAAPALAQDCRLSVDIPNPVIPVGATAQVHVWAHFPASAYAFASSDFFINATMPGWSMASAGVIAGADVLGIQATQLHQPQQGVLADPDNPIRIWTGTFTPASYDPALVLVRATPTGFSIYPSNLTSSSVPCDAGPGLGRMLINPLMVGRVQVAPGQGTTTVPSGPNGIVASSNDDPIVVGLLLPAVQKVREAAAQRPTNMVFDIAMIPTTAGDPMPIEEVSLNFSEIETTYRARTTWPGSILCPVIVLTDGTEVSLPCNPDGALLFGLPRLPDTRQTWIEHTATSNQTSVFIELGFDDPLDIQIPGGPGYSAAAVRLECRNNLRQLGLGLHSYQIIGSSEFQLTFGTGCPVDIDGDGEVNSSDISAFITLWLGSVQNATLAADFNSDGQVNSTDISAFISAWLDAVQNGC